jgi:riboflavin synthase
MFAGIIEQLGTITKVQKEGNNKHFYIQSQLTPELYIDQSIAHNGVCLTVVELPQEDLIHKVTAIHETLIKSNLGQLVTGSKVNLERSIKLETRIDGHHVQGHVDATAKCIKIREVNGSWYFTFLFPEKFKTLLVNKGSVSINGVSLTVIDPTHDSFSVAIIPYTYEHTTFGLINQGDYVNIEFDILGKYVARNLEFYSKILQ